MYKGTGSFQKSKIKILYGLLIYFQREQLSHFNFAFVQFGSALKRKEKVPLGAIFPKVNPILEEFCHPGSIHGVTKVACL